MTDTVKMGWEEREDDPERRLDIGARYDDREKIGQGGMNEVHRVRDRRLGRWVALKRPLPGKTTVDDSLLREALVLARLDHPGIVPVQDLGTDGGRTAYVMKLLQKRDLWDVIGEMQAARKTPLAALPELLPIVLRVGEALAHAHSRDVLHLDLKPQNVIVEGTGGVYLVDFGLTRRIGTQTQEVAGTPSYMAPEQALAEELDERTDVFGLGAILHATATFRPLYDGHEVAHLLYQAQDCAGPDYSNQGLPSGLIAILEKALARDRGQRYPKVAAMVDDLRAFLLGAWNLETRTYEPGIEIVREGEPAQEAYVVVSGRCEILKRTEGGLQKLRELGEGEAFGEIAVLTGGTRSATVRSLEEMIVTPVSKERFDKLLEQSPVLGPFARALANRVVELTEELVDARRKLLEFEIVNLALQWTNLPGGARLQNLIDDLSLELKTSKEIVRGVLANATLFAIDVEKNRISRV